MESGEFQGNFLDPSDRDAERPKLQVHRAAYRRFGRWMDQQLTELVRRWAHLATPNAQRITRPVRPRSKT